MARTYQSPDAQKSSQNLKGENVPYNVRAWCMHGDGVEIWMRLCFLYLLKADITVSSGPGAYRASISLIKHAKHVLNVCASLFPLCSFYSESILIVHCSFIYMEIRGRFTIAIRILLQNTNV